MTWVKKDEKILGFEFEEADSRGILEKNHYHEGCLPKGKDDDPLGKITNYITRETLERMPEHKLLCDGCGEEIKTE